MTTPRNTLIATSRSTKRLRLDNKTMKIISIKSFKDAIERQETQVDMNEIIVVEVEAEFVDR